MGVYQRASGALTQEDTAGLYLQPWRGRTDLERHRVRCVFSEPLHRLTPPQTLAPEPAGTPGWGAHREADRWRAVTNVFRVPAEAVRTLLNDGVTTCFPADCACCGGPLERAGAVPVCDGCLARVVRETPVMCHQCGDSTDLEVDFEDERFARSLGESLLCRPCRMVPPDFVRAVSFGAYDGELRDLLQLFKFNGIRAVAPLLGNRLAEAIVSLEGAAGPDLLVVPVPLYRQRQRERGFNQAELLADTALRQVRRMRPAWRLKPAYKLLRRKRSTESSYTLSQRGRRRNLAGAFEVAGKLAGQEVLLIDDIFTSGATARECARVLVRAGASKVWVATMARARKSVLRSKEEDVADSVAIWDFPATSNAVNSQPAITIEQ